MRILLSIILLLGLAGLTFSGYLSYRELWGAREAATCTPIAEPGSVLAAPPCIYGFFMYLAIVVLSVLALVRRRAAT